MALSQRQRKFLRAKAHHLNPVAFVGQGGLSEAVLKEIDRNLECHELIKVRVRVEERDELMSLLEPMLSHTKAELVQVIGRLVVLYRPSDDASYVLPSA